MNGLDSHCLSILPLKLVIVNMAARWSTLLTAAASLYQTAVAEPVFRETVSFQGPFEVERNGVRNINIEYNGPLDGELAIVYGDCGMRSPFEAHHKIGRTHIGSHPAAKRHLEWTDQRPTKFVWMVPEDVSSGCLHAFVDSQLVGRSSEHSVKSRKMRKRATFAEATDPMGPWFDGVEYLKQKQPDDVFVASVKNKTFGILGAGISGLHTGVSSRGFLIWEKKLTRATVATRFSWNSQLEDSGVFRKSRRPYSHHLPERINSR